MLRLRQSGSGSRLYQQTEVTTATADNLVGRVGNQKDYNEGIFDIDACHFLGFLYTNSECYEGEGTIIDLLWGRPYKRPCGEFPVGVNRMMRFIVKIEQRLITFTPFT